MEMIPKYNDGFDCSPCSAAVYKYVDKGTVNMKRNKQKDRSREQWQQTLDGPQHHQPKRKQIPRERLFNKATAVVGDGEDCGKLTRCHIRILVPSFPPSRLLHESLTMRVQHPNVRFQRRLLPVYSGSTREKRWQMISEYAQRQVRMLSNISGDRGLCGGERRRGSNGSSITPSPSS